MLGNRSVMDAPFNTTSFTAQTIQDQQAKTVRDVLLNDPSVQFTRPTGSSAEDGLNIRGFPVSTSDISYGGLYGMLPYWSVSTELAERIEIIKGPGVLLNGMPPFGSVGGTINVVPKRAGDVPIAQLTTGYGSNSQWGTHLDVGRRFGEFNEFGIRFNGAYRDGETSVQTNKDKMALAVVGLDYRNERIRVSADVGYQEQNTRGLVTFARINPGFAIPAAPDASKNFAPPWTYMERKDHFQILRGEADLTDNLTVWAAVGNHEHQAKPLTLFPAVINANGDYTTSAFKNDLYEKYKTLDAGVRTQVQTGFIHHAVSLQGAIVTRDAGFASVNAPIPASNIYNPLFGPAPFLADPVAIKNYDGSTSSVGIADTMSTLDKRVQLTVGVRQQYVDGNNYAATGTRTSAYASDALSPSVSLVLKPLENVSVYGNYIEGLQQGTIVGTQYANVGQVLPPYQSVQREVGVKVDFGRVTATVSAFEITQPSAILDAPSNTLTVAGEQRNRGVEVNTFGEVASGVRVLGGVTFLDAVLTKSQGGVNDGKRANGVPETQINFGGEWDAPFIPGLTLNGRVIYTSSQLYDLTEPRRSIPDWTRADVGARYTFAGQNGKPVTIRFNVENVFGENYWMSAYGGTLAIGAPRTFRLSSTFNF
ncbi:TonB-dependent receptor [Tardiphaga sp. 42S5]|uniref:TonB-dependent receptor n=1 Tax=Tardiphaga sp. 42S5 TaxID=1404799 RepID=UPI002A5AD9D0|nr:TonB-dependent receptor [Tardiphaga sp. 42S5]WPO40324.1 TonB-dependent receptor [Tardiphaga sp. 42S5]